MYISIEYKERLITAEVVREVAKLSSPVVFLWYIGTYGLKNAGIQFYKEFLIEPIFKAVNSATFNLVDLTAWGALKNRKTRTNKVSCFAKKIDGLNNNHIRCIRSADVFEKMQNIHDKTLLEYFKVALSKDFVRKPSENIPDYGICLGETFENNCSIVQDWYDIDNSKCYSVLQYLEACLLIEDVIEQNIHKEEDIEIVFALPNNETRYYKDETNAFQKDVEFLINYKYSHVKKKINIKFLSFTYGNNEYHRPYNAPGKVLKKHEFNLEALAGNTSTTNKEKK